MTPKTDNELLAQQFPSRKVRFDENGEPWVSSHNPAMRERVREAYIKLYQSDEAGRQLVAVHQEFIARLDALIDEQNAREPKRKARV
jgi:hypothetical protein